MPARRDLGAWRRSPATMQPQQVLIIDDHLARVNWHRSTPVDGGQARTVPSREPPMTERPGDAASPRWIDEVTNSIVTMAEGRFGIGRMTPRSRREVDPENVESPAAAGLSEDGRGGFRTCDLSRVKRDEGVGEVPSDQGRLF